MNNQKTYGIFVCHHKEGMYPSSSVLKHIHVGKALSNKNLSLIGDDTGDHISAKNQSYCELTAHYWAWKNTNYDVYGLFHYRRYLDLSDHKNRSYYIRNLSENVVTKLGLEERNLNMLFDQYDIILPELWNVHLAGKADSIMSIYEHYEIEHIKGDLDKLIKIIEDRYPDYMPATYKTMKSTKAIFCNMFVMKQEYFVEYSKFLFDVLETLEGRVSISEDPYQKRVFGFLSERLLNIYVNKKLDEGICKIKYVPMVLVDPNRKSLLVRAYNRIKKKLLGSQRLNQ